MHGCVQRRVSLCVSFMCNWLMQQHGRQALYHDHVSAKRMTISSNGNWRQAVTLPSKAAMRSSTGSSHSHLRRQGGW